MCYGCFLHVEILQNATQDRKLRYLKLQIISTYQYRYIYVFFATAIL
jgi:hypothetical protein